jgi:hypothetical protein
VDLKEAEKNMLMMPAIELVACVTEVANILTNSFYKSEINQYENKLSGLIRQVAELSNLENNKKNIK